MGQVHGYAKQGSGHSHSGSAARLVAVALKTVDMALWTEEVASHE